MTKTSVVDAQFDTAEVILQNPDRSCPDDVFDTLGVLSVQYRGFDDRVHTGQIVVAIDIMSEVEAFFQQALELAFPIERVIPVSAPGYRWNGKKVLADNLTSGFDYRKVATQKKMSLHSLGRAFDVNPQQNPYIRYEEGGRKEILHVPEGTKHDPSKPGTLYDRHPLVLLMEGFGWTWGGRWTPADGRVDHMHFEKSLGSQSKA